MGVQHDKHGRIAALFANPCRLRAPVDHHAKATCAFILPGFLTHLDPRPVAPRNVLHVEFGVVLTGEKAAAAVRATGQRL